MDALCATVKTEMITELLTVRQKLQQQHVEVLKQQAAQYERRLQQADAEIEASRQAAATLQVALQQKDAIIKNLSDAVAKEKDHTVQAKQFYAWQMQLNDRKREHLASILARRHARLTELRKSFRGWRLIIENKWKDRVERACQARAQEVCHKLSQDYEARIYEVSIWGLDVK